MKLLELQRFDSSLSHLYDFSDFHSLTMDGMAGAAKGLHVHFRNRSSIRLSFGSEIDRLKAYTSFKDFLLSEDTYCNIVLPLLADGDI